MSQEWKWRVGIDTEQGEQAFDSLSRKATEADGALDKIIGSLTTLESSLQQLNTIGASGLESLSNITLSIEGGFAKVSTQLTGVLSRLTQLINLTQEIATASASSWGQGANAADRYADRIVGARLSIAELRAEVERLAQRPEPFMGGESTLGDLFPNLEAYQDAIASIKELSYATQDIEPQRRAQLLAVGYEHEYPELQKYVAAMKEIERHEAAIVSLTEAETNARQQARAAAEAQVKQSPEYELTSFFTERQSTPWSEKFGLGEMTGFEQSLLRVLTIFDQLRGTAQETKLGFADLMQTLEALASMRFQSLGTSIRTNIRTRLEESVVAAGLLIQTLEKLNAMQMGEMPSGQEVAITERPRARGAVGYWSDIAGAPMAEIVTDMTTVSQQVSQVWDNAPEGAGRATERIYSMFAQLKHRLVGDPLVVDMVQEINAWLMQIGGMGSLQGIEQIGQKFLEVQREMQQVMLFEAGGIPGYENSDEIIEKWFVPYREKLQDLHSELGTMLSQADPSQWQEVSTPQGMTFVPPEAVLQQAGREAEAFRVQADEIASAEGGISEAASRVYESLMRQSGAVRTKIQLLHDLRRGTIAAAQSDEELEKMNRRTQGQMERTSALSNRFLRHITWIFQGMVIWGAVRAVQDWVRQFNQGYTEIEASAAHAAFIVETTTDRMMQAQRQYASAVTQYGIGPTEAAPVLPLAERYGMADPRIAELSAQLAMVSDEELSMADAANQLMSVMRAWNISLDDNAKILDTLATMYANVPGSMSGFMDLMREGPALAEQMGQSFEENMLLISRAMSFLPGRTATTVSGTLGRMLSRVYRQDAARELAQEYGISVYDPETLGRRPGLEVLDEIAQKFQTIKSESEKAALAEMVAGTRQGQAWRDAYVMLENWTDGIRDAQSEMRDFDDLVDSMSDTHKTALDEMTASWGNLIQVMGQSIGVMGLIDDAARALSENFQKATREQEMLLRIAESNRDIDVLERRYRQETGERGYQHIPSGGSTLSENFLDWLDKFLRIPTAGPNAIGQQYGQLTPMTNWADAASKLAESGVSFATSVEQAAQTFSDEVESASDRFALLTAMIGTGWTPGTGIVDLSEYSTAEINRAMRQSSIDTQRMINAYRQFLQGEGFGGEAIEQAMNEFTSKLMLQLQFFRLPGNQIRLMEGRDLLFYLSQIEENTRPLEGIWNVPEGMRVWVPIESTFYGEWRNRQGEGEEAGQTVTLDASEFGGHVTEFGAWVGQFDSITAHADSVFTTLRDTYPTQEEGGTVWDEFMRDYYSMLEWLRQSRTGEASEELWAQVPWGQYRTEEWGGLYESAQVYSDATTRFASAVTSMVTPETNWGDAQSYLNQQRRSVPAVTPETNWGDAQSILNTMLVPVIAALGDSEVQVEVPEPLRVDMSQNQISSGVAVGTMQTGMPIALSSLAMATSAMAGAMSSQIYYLMQIAMNTAQPATTVVYSSGGETTTTGGGGSTPAPPYVYTSLMTDWNLGYGSGIVPT